MFGVILLLLVKSFLQKYYTVMEIWIKYRSILEIVPRKGIWVTAEKQVMMIPVKHQKIALEVKLMKLICLRSPLTVVKFYLTV